MTFRPDRAYSSPFVDSFTSKYMMTFKTQLSNSLRVTVSYLLVSKVLALLCVGTFSGNGRTVTGINS